MRNKISINSSKSKQNSPFEFLAIKSKFLPLPSFDHCGQSSGRNQIPQVAGKPTPWALQFDPINYEFWVPISILKPPKACHGAYVGS